MNDFKDEYIRSKRIFVIIFIVFIMSMIFSFLYSMLNPIMWIDFIYQREKILGEVVFFARIILPFFILWILMKRVLSENSESLTKYFFSLPDYYNVKSLLVRSIFGIPPMPYPLSSLYRYPFITLAKSQDLPLNHWARWLGGPATLVIYDGIAVYLERGNQFSRVLGAGLPFPKLGRHERIKAVINLQLFAKKISLRGWTKDGIEVYLDIRADIQILCSDKYKVPIPSLDGKTLELVYPFDPDSAKYIVENTRICFDTSDRTYKERHWDDLALEVIEEKIRAYIAGCMLEELTLCNGDDQIILNLEFEKIFTDIEMNLLEKHVRLRALHLINFYPKDYHVLEKIGAYKNAKRGKYKAISNSKTKALHITETYMLSIEEKKYRLETLIQEINHFDSENFLDSSEYFLKEELEQEIMDLMVTTDVDRESLKQIEHLRSRLGI